MDEEELNSETTDKKRMRMSSNSKIENQSMDVTDDDKFEFDDDLCKF